MDAVRSDVFAGLEALARRFFPDNDCYSLQQFRPRPERLSPEEVAAA